MKKLLLALFIMSSSCTDGAWAKLQSYGGVATIECYSGGKLIYEGTSTGKIKSEANSDGYFFVDKKDNKLKEVSGNCIISYEEY